MDESSGVAAVLNLPDVVEQVRREFERYEAALLAHDVETINSFFLDAAITVRLGVAEHGYGIDAIRAFRRRTHPVSPQRRLQHTVICTIGHLAASVTTEFTAPDSKLLGRQTQTWARTAQGWKIVAAHVSEIPAAMLHRD